MQRDSTTSLTIEAPPAEAQSAVSWGAIIAGALAALALSLLLVALAAGFGLRLASPWPGGRNALGGDLAHFSPTLGAAMIVVQVLASALGGYLAGRLRTKWTQAHGHEVHFRDTAHGLLTWAASTLAGVVLAASVLPALTGGAPAAQVGAAAGSGDATALAPGAVPAVSAAAIDPAAQRRAEREANIAAQFSLFMGIGLLLGAFTACVAAALGGLRRDEMHARFWTEQSAAGTPVRY